MRLRLISSRDREKIGGSPTSRSASSTHHRENSAQIRSTGRYSTKSPATWGDRAEFSGSTARPSTKIRRDRFAPLGERARLLISWICGSRIFVLAAPLCGGLFGLNLIPRARRFRLGIVLRLASDSVVPFGF